MADMNMGPATRKELHYANRVIDCFVDRVPTVDALFRRAVASAPDRIAVTDERERVDYRALDRRVDAVAGNLAQAGLGQGDRLALLIGNRVEFLETVLACARLGLIAVPMSTRQKRAEVEFVLGQCKAAGLVYDAAFADAVPPREAVPALRHRYVIGEPVGDGVAFEMLRAPARPPAVTIAEEDIFSLLYTSGTTGRPKGACLTHLGVLHSLLNYRHGMTLGDGEVSMLAVPASHVTGLVAILLSMVEVAGTTIMIKEFKSKSFLELAARERMTHTLMVPAMYNLCLMEPSFCELDLSAWRVGGFGGAPMPEATIERLAEVVPKLTLLNVYGATETTSPVTMMPQGAIADHLDTVGKVLPCADIIVMDDAGREVEDGMAGELWIAGSMVIPGYWDNPDADRASFTHGYWRSGDVGSIDAEGYVRILDRKKDVINRGGFKIYSIEVENVLAQHPDVVESAVVPRPNSVLGEDVHAFVVPKRPGLSEADLRRHCAEVLSDYKVPSGFTLLDQPLPRNANGKVLKTALKG